MLLAIRVFFLFPDRASYDKEFIANYGQTRLLNNDSFNTSQGVKDAPISSKLSPNAASFSQGASFTLSNTATNMYPNPLSYSYSNFYTTPPERTMTYSQIDNRVSLLICCILIESRSISVQG